LNGANDPTESLPSRKPGPDELAETDESERSLDAAWLKLERKQRVLLSLRAEGYGLEDIEAITGISRRVLRARLHRARLSLARYLQDAEGGVAALPRTGRNR
jgi:DNA-directed RNA polymerase specialized sigma24 family protein